MNIFVIIYLSIEYASIYYLHFVLVCVIRDQLRKNQASLHFEKYHFKIFLLPTAGHLVLAAINIFSFHIATWLIL